MSDKNRQRKEGSKKTEKYDEEYPENGDNFSTGAPDNAPQPNNPAKNAEKKAPGHHKDKHRKSAS